MTLQIQALPHQWEFWQDFTDRARIMLVGPLGTGKTESFVHKDFFLHLNNVTKKGRGFRAMGIEPTFGMVEDILIPAYREIMQERYEIDIEIKGEKGRPLVVWPPEFGGAQTMLRSAEVPQRLAGPNLSHVLYDEPAQIQFLAFKRSVDRARHQGAACRQAGLCGSPEGLGWTSDLFANPKPPYKTIRAVEWHTDLSHYPGDLEVTYSDDPAQYDSYVRALFVPLFGKRCYRGFHVDNVVTDEGWLDLVTSDRLPLYLSCDFNIDAMRWNAYQQVRGHVHAIGEIALGENGTIKKAARQFIEMYHPKDGQVFKHPGPIIVTGDASGGARDFTGKTAYQELLAELEPVWKDMHGRTLVKSKVLKSNPAVIDRVRNVNWNLANRRVWIWHECEELIKDMEQVVWCDGRPEIKKDPTPPNNQRTHASDNLGYLLWQISRMKKVRGKKSNLIKSGTLRHAAAGATW